MKTRKLNKKLGLSKSTIANLNRKDLLAIKVGAMPATDFCTDPIHMTTCGGIGCDTDSCSGHITCWQVCY